MWGIVDIRAWPPQERVQGVPGIEHLPPQAREELLQGTSICEHGRVRSSCKEYLGSNTPAQAHQEPVKGMREIEDVRL